MVLPLYLAMTAGEMAEAAALPRYWSPMGCHFDPTGPGLRDIPARLPPGAMLILDDAVPCCAHDPNQVASELAEAVRRLNCESVLLDFERKADTPARMVADALFQALPCPVAAPPELAEDSDCAVFLPPCPLHTPLAEYLRPWQGRDIWLEAALLRQTVTVTPSGTAYGPAAPADRQAGGTYDETLHCLCRTEIAADAVRFILSDTPQTLARKLERAAALGVTRAVGLYQELGAFDRCILEPDGLK